MYTMTIDDRILFDPTLLGFSLEQPKLALEANKFGTLTFTIYPNHPEYANISIKTSRIKVYNDDTLIFECRPAQYRRTLHNGYEWTCEDALSRLNDVAWRPEKYTKGAGDNYALSWLLGKYNTVIDNYFAVIDPQSQIDHDYMKFTAGDVDVSGYDNEIETKDVAYDTIWDMIVANTIDKHGGYLVPEYSEFDGITLNYLDEDNLPTQEQDITLGFNMQDLTIETETEDLFTVLIPLGKDQAPADPSVASDKKLPLTISGLYIKDNTKVTSYGWIEHIETWDDVDNATTLATKGQEYYTKHAGKIARTMTINALDLHDAGVNVDSLVWLAKAHVVSSVHNIEEWYPIRRMELSLGEPQASNIEIGNERETMTDRLRKDARKAQKYYTALDDRVWDLEDTSV